MTINELKKLIEAGDVNEIVIFSMYSEIHNPAYKALSGSLYTIHAYDYDEKNSCQFRQQATELKPRCSRKNLHQH